MRPQSKYSACSLLRVDGQRPCPLPREGDHSLFFLVHGCHPTSQYVPSPQGECGQRQAWVPQAGCSMEKSFLPQNRQNPKSLLGFQASRTISHYCLLSPCTKNEACFLSATLNDILHTAFLHMKQTCKKEERLNIFLQVPAHPGGSTAPITQPVSRHQQLSSQLRPAPKTLVFLLQRLAWGVLALTGERSLASKFPQFLHMRVPWGLRGWGAGGGKGGG